MSYTVANVKTRIGSHMHGTTTDSINNINGVIEEAARSILTDIDPAETKRPAQITNALYGDVYIYTAPSDLKGNAVIDLRPQVNRSIADNFSHNANREFDMYKSNDSFTVEHRSGTKFLRVSKDLNAAIKVGDMGGLTNDGTWSATSDAANLTQDNLYYVTGSSSLNFDLDGLTTSGYIENTTMTAVDLSSLEDIGAMFLWVYLPDASTITNVDLIWGNDTSANYWNRTVTAPHVGSFENGWNLLRFDWNGATQTGSPSASTVDSVRITITYDGVADTDIRVDGLFAQRGQIWDLVYYSNAMFRTTGGVWGQTITADTDIVNLDDIGINMLIYKACEIASMQLQDSNDSVDPKKFESKYLKEKRQYTRMFTSERINQKTNYYRPFNTGYHIN